MSSIFRMLILNSMLTSISLRRNILVRQLLMALMTLTVSGRMKLGLISLMSWLAMLKNWQLMASLYTFTNLF
jgi:hypothetical protein